RWLGLVAPPLLLAATLSPLLLSVGSSVGFRTGLAVVCCLLPPAVGAAAAANATLCRFSSRRTAIVVSLAGVGTLLAASLHATLVDVDFRVRAQEIDAQFFTSLRAQ